MNTQQAINQFVIAAAAQAVAIECGDYKTANKQSSIIAKCTGFLKSIDSLLELKPYLTHPNVGVRVTTATYLLPVVEVEAIAVLNSIALDKAAGIQVLNAQTALSEWEKKRLNLYFIFPKT